MSRGIVMLVIGELSPITSLAIYRMDSISSVRPSISLLHNGYVTSKEADEGKQNLHSRSYTSFKSTTHKRYIYDW